MQALLAVLLFLAPASLVEDAHRALTLNDWARAARLAETATDDNPTDLRAWIVRGLAELHGGRAGAARDSFRRCTELAPEVATTWFNLGSAAFESGHFGEAERAFARAASLDPKLAALAELNAGLAAIRAERTSDAERHLRAGLKRAPVSDAALQHKAELLLEEVEAEREETQQKSLRSLITEGKEALLSGRNELGRQRLHAALKLAHSTVGGEEVEEQIADVLESGKPKAAARLTLELGVGAGYDSNVPQSGIVVIEPTASADQNPQAAFFSLNLDLAWRFAGSKRNGGLLVYELSQLAYASDTLDGYSLQDHTLRLAGQYSPHERVTLEAAAEGVLIFTGIKSFAPFQVGVGLGPQLTVREGEGWETRLKYAHTFKWSLASEYDFLTGQRDEASLTESWQRESLHLSLAYLFRREAIGEEQALVTLLFPQNLDTVFGPLAVYHIPYSFLGHELTLGATRKLPGSLEAALTFRYEHRDYAPPSFIANPQIGFVGYRRTRIDDRYTVEASLSRSFQHGLSLDLSYTFLASRSTIDSHNPLTFLDYDNKNFFKHVVELQLSYSY